MPLSQVKLQHCSGTAQEAPSGRHGPLPQVLLSGLQQVVTEKAEHRHVTLAVRRRAAIADRHRHRATAERSDGIIVIRREVVEIIPMVVEIIDNRVAFGDRRAVPANNVAVSFGAFAVLVRQRGIIRVLVSWLRGNDIRGIIACAHRPRIESEAGIETLHDRTDRIPRLGRNRNTRRQTPLVGSGHCLAHIGPTLATTEPYQLKIACPDVETVR